MKILLVANRNNPETLDAMFQIAAYLDSQGIGHSELDVTDLPDAAFPLNATQADIARRFGEGYSMVVTLGGDGTLLHAARLADALRCPLLGINFGHLGFLTNSAHNGIVALLADALADEIVREERMNLYVSVVCEGDSEEAPEFPRTFFVFNEIAIARGALGHIVEYDLAISGDKIAHMRGDGVVVATATGSTAYSLSAGGPLVGPSHRGMIVTPLAPHTLNSRAIVCEHRDVVEVWFELGSQSASEVSLFADGDALHFERPISSVVVMLGKRPTTLLTRREESFYKQISRTFFN